MKALKMLETALEKDAMAQEKTEAARNQLAQAEQLQQEAKALRAEAGPQLLKEIEEMIARAQLIPGEGTLLLTLIRVEEFSIDSLFRSIREKKVSPLDEYFSRKRPFGGHFEPYNLNPGYRPDDLINPEIKK